EYTEAEDSRLEGKDPSCLYMDGGEIFNFTLRAVPSLVEGLLRFSDKTVDDYDSFLFHQANLFMIKHLTKKAKLPPERVPLNIEEFGNTSCASIPLLMSTVLREKLKDKSLRLAMFGFGVGYSWGAAAMSVGPLKVIETIEL
ncbi:3-oxoacyl-ACP synthase III family protein, partial [Cupriavidus basilensis]|uniref:3-oxoacyl-ACP synthase III family protein n=1 Tax=Cupriavidus basilensis TaxID=68895 RepID=UPI0023E763CD